MEYSISALAKKARVTPRTLRHYDQIGLLKPRIRMAGGKRLYTDEEVLRFYEIVFFKKVGISLPKIKEIFCSKNPVKAAAAAMAVRKEALSKEIKKLQRYAACIETALPQYANCSMSQKERLEKFIAYQNLVKEVEGIQVQEVGKKVVEQAKKNMEQLSEDEVDRLTDESNKLMKEFVKAVEQGFAPDSKEAQALIRRNYDMMAKFQLVTKEIFIKLRDNILNLSEFYKAYHPKLPEFLYEAMDVFTARFFK